MSQYSLHYGTDRFPGRIRGKESMDYNHGLYSGNLIDLILSLNDVTKMTLIGLRLALSLQDNYLWCLNDIYTIAP